MAEQIPEAWIGEEVTIAFGTKGGRNVGELQAVGDKGLAIKVMPPGGEEPIEL